MKNILRSLVPGLTAMLLSSTAHAAEPPKECYLFAYFINNGEDGLHLAWSTVGPFTPVPGNITPPGSWVEGPTALHVGKEIILYFDAYTRHRYEALATTDFKTWRNVSKDLSLPVGIRHGTAFAVSDKIISKLLGPAGSRNDIEP